MKDNNSELAKELEGKKLKLDKEKKNTKDSALKDLKLKRYKVSQLSYEESLHSLDQILESLQSDEVSLSDIKTKYIEGSIYLEHCDKLLKEVEQEVENLDLDQLN